MMEREKVTPWVLLVWMACGVVSISVHQTSDYCSRSHMRLVCVFTNTSEEVDLGEFDRGLRSLKVEGATVLRGSAPCGVRLHVLSSVNVTLQGALKRAAHQEEEEEEEEPVGLRWRRSSKEHQADDDHPPAGGPAPGVTVLSTTSQQTVTSSVSRTSVSVSVSTEERRAACVLNVSVAHSEVHWLRGQFDELNVESSYVVELAGEVGRLGVRSNSTVSNFSVSGDRLLVEETRVLFLSRLEARQQLLFRDVVVGSLVSPGLVLHESRDEGGVGSTGVHTLSEVRVDTIATEAVQVVSGRVSITNLVAEEVHSAAFMVRDGGVLTLKNVNIRRGPTTCLVLHGGAKIVLLNFTLGDDTVSDFELSSKGLQRTAYPLHTLRYDGDVILPRIGPKRPASEKKDVATMEIPGFPWYWVVIMSLVGIFAGIVVGSAIMWRRPNLMKGQPSALTLSDLIGRDGLQEDAVSRASDTLRYPELQRQDSGLTSSSFASFSPCQEKPQTAHLFPKQQQQQEQKTQNPDCISDSAYSSEPSVYVHVAPIPCTSEVVVYEEVQALSASKVEYNPQDEVKLTSELSGFDKEHSTEHVC